jgi:hypothetical protein
MHKTLPPPLLSHVCDLAIEIGPPIEVGPTASGLRRVIPITGGLVSGPLLRGRVLPAGADFQLIHEGATLAHLDARYVLELEDATHVYVHNVALRVAGQEDAQRLIRGEPVDPAAVYFRCQPRLEAAGQDWAWLARSQFIGTGQRSPDRVFLSFYRVC